jgi:hypothetical protein
MCHFIIHISLNYSAEKFKKFFPLFFNVSRSADGMSVSQRKKRGKNFFCFHADEIQIKQ